MPVENSLLTGALKIQKLTALTQDQSSRRGVCMEFTENN
jgi:hypothetical protein